MSHRDDLLLAAYVDGVSELSVEERRRIEAALARDAGLRVDELATRDLVAQLRSIASPEPSSTPDWSALERSIHDAVGPDVPRPWWRRVRWHVPAIALAAATALVVIAGTRPDGEAPSLAIPTLPIMAPPAPEPAAPESDTVALYLDGHDLEVELGAEAALDDPLDVPLDVPLDALGDVEVVDGFLPSELAIGMVDDLDDEALDRLWSDFATTGGPG